jgi:hypothetical protein
MKTINEMIAAGDRLRADAAKTKLRSTTTSAKRGRTTASYMVSCIGSDCTPSGYARSPKAGAVSWQFTPPASEVYAPPPNQYDNDVRVFAASQLGWDRLRAKSACLWRSHKNPDQNYCQYASICAFIHNSPYKSLTAATSTGRV